MFIIVLVAALLTSTTAFAQEAAQNDEPQKRPALLIPLYLTNIAVNAADVHSTIMALKAGGVEANPILNGMDSAQLITMKVISVGTGIMLAEKLWKRHRVAAVTVMIISNTAVGVIAARNYHLAAR